VKTSQEELRARANGQRGDPVKERIEVIRPGLPKDVSLLHLAEIFPALARHGRRLAFALQQVGVEDFHAQGINQKRAAPSSLPENLYEWLPPARPIESTLTDPRRAQDLEKLGLCDRQGSAPIDDYRRWRGLHALHKSNRNIKRRIVNRINAVYFSMITSVLFRSI
jgi:hypothetical protein